MRYKNRWQMQSAADTYSPGGLPCYPGFQIVYNNVLGAAYNQTAYIATGDVNGDGISDIVVSNGSNIYIFFGSRTGFSQPADTVRERGLIKYYHFRQIARLLRLRWPMSTVTATRTFLSGLASSVPLSVSSTAAPGSWRIICCMIRIVTRSGGRGGWLVVVF